MHTEDLLPLVIIVAVAFMAPIVSLRIRHLRVPAIILEILLGVFLGRSGIGVLSSTPVIDFLAEFGFIFLMFLSGFEIDLSLLRSGRARGTITLPLSIFVTTLAVSLLFSLALLWLGLITNVTLFALILSTTSVGIVMPTLKERGELGTPYGQTLVISALVADLSTVSLLTFSVIYETRGFTIEGFLVAVVFITFAVAYAAGRSLRRFTVIGSILEELAHASTQIKVRGSLAALVCFVVLAKAVGVEAILSAFLTGLLVSFLARKSRLVLGAKLDAVGYGFFIPFFFIMVGARLELAEVLGTLDAFILIPLLVVFAFIVKLAPACLLRRRFCWRDTLAGGALLSSRLALIIAASQIALSIGAITHALNAAVVVTAVVTCLVSPVVYIKLRGLPRTVKPRVFVIGCGRIGRELIERLHANDVEVVVIERSHTPRKELASSTVTLVVGDGNHEGTLEHAGLASTDVFVALTDDDETNLRACRLARERFGVHRTIARDNHPENVALYERDGVVPLEMNSTVAIAAEALVLRPTFMSLMSHRSGDVFAFEITLEAPSFVGRRVRDLTILGEALLVVIRRDTQHVIPHGDTALEAGDSIVFLGTAADETRLREALERPLPRSSCVR